MADSAGSPGDDPLARLLTIQARRLSRAGLALLVLAELVMLGGIITGLLLFGHTYTDDSPCTVAGETCLNHAPYVWQGLAVIAGALVLSLLLLSLGLLCRVSATHANFALARSAQRDERPAA